MHSLSLKESIRSNKPIEAQIRAGLLAAAAVVQLGIEVLGINILAVKAIPEMERALEAQTREQLQQEANQAVYERRNFTVEQERRIMLMTKIEYAIIVRAKTRLNQLKARYTAAAQARFVVERERAATSATTRPSKIALTRP